MPWKKKPFGTLFVKTDDDGCWLWIGSKCINGYGRFNVGAHASRRAHRVAWEVEFGEIPNGMFVCHACDTPLCVRPSHLFIGTAADNYKDMTAKGRGRHPGPSRPASGEKNGRVKLKDSEVAEIRRRYVRGLTRQVDIAAAYGIKQAQVSRIIRGVTRVDSAHTHSPSP